MVWHPNNQKLLRYLGIVSAVGAVLFLRTSNWTVAGICFAVSGTAFALCWLSAKAHHH